jgi:hypothetical protein
MHDQSLDLTWRWEQETNPLGTSILRERSPAQRSGPHGLSLSRYGHVDCTRPTELEHGPSNHQPALPLPESQWPEFDWRRPLPSFPGTYSNTATSIAVLPAVPRHPQGRVAPVQITRPIQILQVNWDRERLDRQVAHTVLYVHGIPWQKQTPVTFLFLTGGEQDDGAVTRWLPEFRFVPTSRCPCHDNWLTWTSRRPESIIGSIMSWVLGSTCPYLNVCVISFPIVDPRAEWISVFN